MGKRITVEIKACDIRRGVKGSACNCAAALAIRRLFPNFAVSVAPGTARRFYAHVDACWDDDDIDRSYRLARCMWGWIRRFDKKKSSVRPCRFTMIEE